MVVEITPQSIVGAAAFVSAALVLIKLFASGVRLFDRNKAQDSDLVALKEQHNRDMEELKREQAGHLREVKEEQTLLTYGILACLKGLKEQGCNGPVTEAVDMIEKHLNKKAHQ